MAKVDIRYDIVGSYSYTVDLDEYADDILDEYGKPWEELSDDEKDEFMYGLGNELCQTAEAECDYSLGEIWSWNDENYTEHFFR